MNIRILSQALLAVTSSLVNAATLDAKAKLGAQLFFDTQLSEPAGQACASCHAPQTAFTDPDKSAPTSKGAHPHLHGNRNTPTAMYAAYSPAFGYDKSAETYIGGQFLDGRAATLNIQAQKPFLNPLEMANPNISTLIAKVRRATYTTQFNTIYGANALNDTTKAFARVADAIAAYERSPVLNRFTAKYDYYLWGKATLSAQEQRGRLVFESSAKGNCAACHPNRPNGGIPPLLTDHSYDNLGVPKNPANPYYQLATQFNPQGWYYQDLGLGDILNLPSEDGKFKVPTLRNLTLTAPYMHNGYFKTLRGVVEFYSNRDLKPRCRNPWASESEALTQKCWPAPETPTNVNHEELGFLNLSARDVDDLLAFLRTLTDGYGAISPWPYKTP
jgi:cytochrome c peroxidase